MKNRLLEPDALRGIAALSVVLIYVLLSFFPLSNIGISLMEMMVNLSMLQEWFQVKSLDGVYWTLSLELCFYAMMLVIFLCRTLKWIEFLGMVGLVVIYLAAKLEHLWSVPLPQILHVTFLLDYGHLFFAGIIFYRLKTKGHAWFRYLCLITCLLMQYVVGNPISIFIVAGIFIVFYLFVLNRLSVMANPAFVFLGSISYCLYLIHSNLGYVTIRYLYSFNAHPWLVVLIPLMISIGVATLMMHLIEQPALKLIRERYREKKHSSQESTEAVRVSAETI